MFKQHLHSTAWVSQRVVGIGGMKQKAWKKEAESSAMAGNRHEQQFDKTA